jgi:pimeloyl-ACP methyl ester carboxylesterase
LYAERVAGLALVASHVSADAAQTPHADRAQRELAASRDALAARLETEASMDAAVESYLPRYFAPAVYRDRTGLVERALGMMRAQNPRGCAQLVRGMKERLDSHDLLEDIAVPALVVAGGADS